MSVHYREQLSEDPRLDEIVKRTEKVYGVFPWTDGRTTEFRGYVVRTGTLTPAGAYYYPAPYSYENLVAEYRRQSAAKAKADRLNADRD